MQAGSCWSRPRAGFRSLYVRDTIERENAFAVQILTSLHIQRPSCRKYVLKVKNVSFALCLRQTCVTFLSCCCLSVLSSGSGLEGELFGMGMWSLGLGAVGAALAGIFLANTDLCLPKVAQASLEHLENADLRSTVDGRQAL